MNKKGSIELFIFMVFIIFLVFGMGFYLGGKEETAPIYEDLPICRTPLNGTVTFEILKQCDEQCHGDWIYSNRIKDEWYFPEDTIFCDDI